MPDGWSASAGTGDTALVLSGPDGMMAKVTIASTDLAPDTAFLRYIASEPLPRREFAVTGALLCGYSGQLLTGTLQSPAGDIDFADRIVHLWTNSKQYLVAIHVTGRSAGFAAAKAALTQDFAVVIP
ncbi:hypothetical protein A9W95_15350 [Mycobacterium sp. 1423905.2]|nr:hypothetical protein A9W95_15350 [Mycobacterium sp. 1423905.2]